jgi:hypothetical protein
MNLAVRFVADRVNLRTKPLPRRCRILIERRLNPSIVLLKQRPNLLLSLAISPSEYHVPINFLEGDFGTRMGQSELSGRAILNAAAVKMVAGDGSVRTNRRAEPDDL